MDAKHKQSKRRDDVLSSLNVIIEGLNLAENLSSITPAKAVFSTASTVLTMIRDSMVNEEDYVDLGLACNAVCTALDRGLKGKQLSELGGSVLDAISQLTMTVADIRSKIVERSKQNGISRAFHAKNDSQTIAGWRADLNRILLVFNTELGLNIYVTVSDVREGVTKTQTVVADTHTIVSETRRDVADTHTVVSEVQRGFANTHVVVADTHAMVSDIRRQILGNREEDDDQHRLTQTSITGESPPPAPRACFGRDELIDKIVGLAENLTPIALVGAGGIGKTSIALAVLHHDRIRQRFGVNRRFIRCEQFSASSPHLLSRLSKVIGAGIENPKDLASLRPFLSSREFLIVLDNAESILDPEGTNAEEIYGVVEELSQFDNICLCITSRISAVPPDCDTLDIPTLSIDASRDAFHRICKNVERSDLVDDILGQLDFHPLSITLLATVAHQNRWSTERLTREWGIKRTRVLQTMHNKSLATTIELSLASPMFQDLGPDARALLEVVAFFPQGVDENNLSWLFPTISDGANVFDRFCVLSLAYRSNSFVTMLAPLRDHLRPKDPKSSPLLCTAMERYFTRMSVDIDPDEPEYRESRWIVSEDVNVEHLLDVFTTIDASSDSVWDACADFVDHLDWHKGRLTILGPKMEGLPDNHHSKPKCLFALSQLFHSIGNYVENKRLLTDALKLHREREDDHAVARTLKYLSHASQHMGLHEEGIRLAEEALEIFKQLSDTVEQAKCLMDTARLLYSDDQLDAAEEAACRAIDLISGKGERSLVCQSHRILGNIYRAKDDTEKAIQHFEAASEIASSFNWDDQLFFIHAELASLFIGEDRFDDARNQLERAMLYMTSSTYYPGYAMEVQAALWRKQGRLEEARSEILRAADVYEKLGASQDLEGCRDLLREIEEEMTKSINLDDESKDDDGWVTESE